MKVFGRWGSDAVLRSLRCSYNYLASDTSSSYELFHFTWI